VGAGTTGIWAFVALTISIAFVPPRASAQDTTPGANLGGYVGQASAMAFSFQPVFPALVSTGDVPVEATIALSTADLKSGGNAYGHASLLWPGDAAADPGPLFAQAAGQPSIAGYFPTWSVQAQARQGDGVVTTGAPPAVVMKATGFPDQASGDSRVADLDVPGLAHIEHIASTASSVVTATSITTQSHVVLHGVTLLNAQITADEIESTATTTSDGTLATTSGTTKVSGLKIGGIGVTVTDRGFTVDGSPTNQVPGSGGGPFPGQSPADQVQQALGALHARLTLFRSVGRVTGGAADRYATGFVLSVDNPAAGVGPIPPGRFDVILASTSSQTLASPPFVFTPPSLNTGGTAPAAPAPSSVSIGGGPSVLPETLNNATANPGTYSAPSTAVGTLNAVTQRSEYKFGGVPVGLVLGLLAAAAVAAGYLRRAFSAVVNGP
jgi:hypothetical protein